MRLRALTSIENKNNPPMNTRSLLKNPRLWLAVAVVAAALLVWRWSSGDAEQPEYQTAVIDRGDISAQVTATGTLSALVTVEVGSQVSGRVQALMADFNTKVSKGQLIATIDPSLFEAEALQSGANLEAAQAELLRAQVQARDARRQSDRARELATTGLLSKGEAETAAATADAADASVAAARAGVTQARAALTRANTNLAYTRIVSPTDGVIISRSVDVGQTVAASLQAPVLFTIAQDLRQMQVNTSVSESDVGRIKEDMPASFTVDAYPRERFEGRVRQVRDVATVLQNVVTYDAVINVENPDLKLKPGMTANVSFTYAHREHVLRVPNAALRFRPPTAAVGSGTQQSAQQSATAARGAGRAAGGGRGTGSRVIWLLRNGEIVAVPVTTGISDGVRTEVVSGEVQEGDQVVTDVLNAAVDANAAVAPRGRMF